MDEDKFLEVLLRIGEMTLAELAASTDPDIAEAQQHVVEQICSRPTQIEYTIWPAWED